jgi:hypothetical protein
LGRDLEGDVKPPTKRRTVPKPPPSVQPHRAAILAVDAGKQGGWAIFLAGRLVQFGELHGYDLVEVTRVVAALLQLSQIAALPVVLVLERPAEYRRSGARSFSTVLGMGGARGVWRAAWVSAGCSERRIVDAPIATWRSRVLGAGITRLKREQVRPIEQAAARALVIRELGLARAAQVGPDSAPAILIGKYASHAATVAKRIPTRSRAA